MKWRLERSRGRRTWVRAYASAREAWDAFHRRAALLEREGWGELWLFDDRGRRLVGCRARDSVAIEEKDVRRPRRLARTTKRPTRRR